MEKPKMSSAETVGGFIGVFLYIIALFFFSGGITEAIRYGVQKGLPTGNDKFKQQVEKALSIKLRDGKRGRPKIHLLSDSTETNTK